MYYEQVRHKLYGFILFHMIVFDIILFLVILFGEYR